MTTRIAQVASHDKVPTITSARNWPPPARHFCVVAGGALSSILLLEVVASQEQK
jgi:hypothetical protein